MSKEVMPAVVATPETQLTSPVQAQTVSVFQADESVFDVFKSGSTVPLDEVAETWTPEAIGETKRLLFVGAGVELFYDETSNTTKPNAKAYFVELREINGQPYLKRIKMGTIEVVAHLADIHKTNGVVSEVIAKTEYLNTMWDITLTGQRKSKTNALNKINTFQMRRVFLNL